MDTDEHRSEEAEYLCLSVSSVVSFSLTHFLDDGFQFRWHFGDRYSSDLHRPVGCFFESEIKFCVFRVFARKIVAILSAAALLSLEGRPRDGLADDEKILEVECGVPAGIEINVARHKRVRRAVAQNVKAVECL